jgi:hypothetical protein
LFDLDYSRLNLELDMDRILHCYKEYITFSIGKRPPSKKEFLTNLEAKMVDPNFIGDMEALLRPEIVYNQSAAFDWLKGELVERM